MAEHCSHCLIGYIVCRYFSHCPLQYDTSVRDCRCACLYFAISLGYKYFRTMDI